MSYWGITNFMGVLELLLLTLLYTLLYINGAVHIRYAYTMSGGTMAYIIISTTFDPTTQLNSLKCIIIQSGTP